MSFHSYHTYGYGVETTKMNECELNKIRALVHLAPKYEQKISRWFDEEGISNPTYDDYLEYEDCEYIGVATILSAVIFETEGVEFTACDDFKGRTFILYEPSYPWNMSEKEKDITTDKIQAILARYFSFIVDEPIIVDFFEPENGG